MESNTTAIAAISNIAGMTTKSKSIKVRLNLFEINTLSGPSIPFEKTYLW